MDFWIARNVLNVVISLVLGILVLYRNPRSKVNQIFSLYCLSIVYWDFVDLNIVTAESLSRAQFWSALDAFGPTLATAFILHFIVEFTEQSKLIREKLIYFAAYIPLIILSIVDIGTGAITGTVTAVENGWGLDLAGDSLYFLVSPVTGSIVIATFFISLFLSIRYYQRSIDPIKKKQSSFVIIGIVLLGLLYSFDGLMKILQVEFPEISVFGFTMLSLVIGYAVTRYEMFTIDPITASDSIISAMSDILILFDLKGRVVKVNEQAYNLLGYREDEILKKSFYEIYAGDESIRFSERIVKPLQKMKALSFLEGFFRAKNGRLFPVSLSYSAIRSKDDVLRGVVCIARDISNVKKTQKQMEEYAENLEKLNKTMIGRELRMAELKRELAKLKNGSEDATADVSLDETDSK